MKRILFCFLLLSVLTSQRSYAQSACEITLTKAQEEFDAGRFFTVPEILEECLQKNQNRQWEQRAYLLLAETYLLLQNPVKADECYLNVLRANPEYETDESRDPIDLVYLSKKFTASPIFSFYANLGLNTSIIRVIHDVKISKNTNEKYSLKLGWQASVGIDYHYNNNWGLAAELNYAFTRFTHGTKGLHQAANYSLEFNERQTWLSVPLLVKYNIPDSKLRPYFEIGYAVNVLMNDEVDFVLNNNTESPVYDFKDQRNTINRSFIAGAGLKYKWGLRYLYADLRYTVGNTNLVKDNAQRYNGLHEEVPYIDDDFKIDNLFISIGYIYPFYKPRQLKKARTKSVLRKTR